MSANTSSNIIPPPTTDTDETYGYWEPLHFLLFGKSMQTWEYSPEFAIRSYAFLTPFYYLARFCMFLKLSKMDVFFAVKGCLGLFSAYAQAEFLDSLKVVLGERVMFAAFVMSICSAGTFFYATSLLPSAICANLQLLAFSYFLRGYWASHQKGTASKARWNTWWTSSALCILCGCIAVVWSGWPFIALLYVPLGVCLIASCFTLTASSAEGYLWLGTLLVTGIELLVVVLAGELLVDRYYYGKW